MSPRRVDVLLHTLSVESTRPRPLRWVPTAAESGRGSCAGLELPLTGKGQAVPGVTGVSIRTWLVK